MESRNCHNSGCELMKKDKLNRKRAVVLAGILTLLLACEPQQTTETDIVTVEQTVSQPSRTLLTRGVYSDLTMDLHHAQQAEQFSFLQDIFEGLVILDKQGNIIPALAQHWHSEDNKLWRIELREGLFWSNGERFLAQDVVKSWQQLAISSSPLKSYLAFINLANATKVIANEMAVEQLGIQAEDDRTLVIQLDKPTPYLIKMLAHIALLPVYQGQLEQGHFVTNGAYQVVGQQADTIHLNKNPYYWDEKNVAFKQVDYKKISPQQAKEVDIITNPQGLSDNLVYFDKLCSYYYEFNFRHPQLQQKNIRQALTALLSLTSINSPDLRLTRHFLPKNLQQSTEENWFSVVPEQLLQQQGISETQPLTLRLSYDDTDTHRSIAEQLVRMWSQSDMLRIEANPLSWQQLQQQRIKGDFDIIRSGWCADYNDPSAFLSVLYSHSPDNKMSYYHPQVDALLEQSLSQQDPVELAKTYADLERLVQDDYVVLPLFQYVQPVYLTPSIAGYETSNPTGVMYSKDLYRRVE